MKLKRKPSLKLILTISFLIFSLVLLATLWIFQTVFLEEFYKGVKTTQVRTCARSVNEHLDESEVFDLIADIEEQNSMLVTVYKIQDDESMDMLYRTSRAGIFNSTLSTEFFSVMYHKTVEAGGEYSEITQNGQNRRFIPEDILPDGAPATGDQENIFDFRNKDDKEDNREFREPSLEREKVMRLAYAVVNTQADNDRLIIIESEITPVNSVVETLRYQLLLVTAVIVIISVIIAIITALRIARPIARTNTKAKLLAQQDYDVRFSQDGYKEVAELNQTLNYAAEELGKVDKLRRELIANISHDLRTPLTMITGYSEVMRDLPGEVTPENLQIIIDESNHLNSLVSDLLDISRLESGTAEMNIVPFSLTRCIENIFERYTKLIEVDGYNIVFEREGEVFVNGDEMRITQVLYNLINNAVNYVGEDKTVIVRQTVIGDQVRVDVIDHGEGIAPDQLEYIWDRYYRVDKEHKQAKIGTGLGLSIVKNILKAHDADYGVESELGKGSDFYFVMNRIETE